MPSSVSLWPGFRDTGGMGVPLAHKQALETVWASSVVGMGLGAGQGERDLMVFSHTGETEVLPSVGSSPCPAPSSRPGDHHLLLAHPFLRLRFLGLAGGRWGGGWRPGCPPPTVASVLFSLLTPAGPLAYQGPRPQASCPTLSGDIVAPRPSVGPVQGAGATGPSGGPSLVALSIPCPHPCPPRPLRTAVQTSLRMEVTSSLASPGRGASWRQCGLCASHLCCCVPDVDECVAETPPCSDAQYCQNLDGSFTCEGAGWAPRAGASQPPDPSSVLELCLCTATVVSVHSTYLKNLDHSD